MRTFIYFLILLVGLLSFNSCKQETVADAKKLSLEKDFNLIKIKSDYELKILNYMVSTYELNDEASLQYMSPIKEEYIVILNEPKQEFIDAYTELNSYNNNKATVANYSDVQIAFLDEAMAPIHRTEPKSISINGLSVHYVEMDAIIEGVNEEASYFIYYLESESNLYTAMAWTLKKNKDIFREKVRKMIYTFKSNN